MNSVASTASGGSSILGVLVALVLVVGLILALGWLTRRFGGASTRGHGLIRVVASAPLGMKERLVVIECGGRQLLLGVTATAMSVLDRYDTPLPAAQDTGGAGPMGFAALLRGAKTAKPAA